MAECPAYDASQWLEVDGRDQPFPNLPNIVHTERGTWSVGEHGMRREVVVYFSDGSSKIITEFTSSIEYRPRP